MPNFCSKLLNIFFMVCCSALIKNYLFWCQVLWIFVTLVQNKNTVTAYAKNITEDWENI